MTTWKITSGRGSRYTDEFVDEGVVAVALDPDTDFVSCASKEEIAALVSARHPLMTDRQISVAASQHWRFLNEVNIGDLVLVYAPQTRLYHYGEILSDASFALGRIPEHPVVRHVNWRGTVERDALSTTTKNSLGAILTLFKVPHNAATEVAHVFAGELESHSAGDQTEAELEEVVDPFADIEELALERVKDRINSLDWDDMQELVASLLRALGYRTSVSAVGPDRGKDIVASRDGFGFERPRIVVEVKHRRGQMGSQEIRSFLGGRHADDRGLYVSTGGFTKDARYEAERASTVTHLMTLDELAKAIVEQYDRLDQDGRRLLPLTKIYWPG
ncbi:restriction endonuclease [Altererythrobacter sp. MTPC7]|uniref:restriction endonuclease n=1 Tax=Altererythrobacter sp. MTPC7 TaxID=3056567 RepID=UPI0036F24592